jgi:hypothetical protein
MTSASGHEHRISSKGDHVRSPPNCVSFGASGESALWATELACSLGDKSVRRVNATHQ